MSAELRPEDCPLYPDKPTAKYKLLGIEYKTVDYGPIPGGVIEAKPCLALELPNLKPGVYNRGNCRRCAHEIDTKPVSAPWGKTS